MEESIKKADVLIEALPYIKKFQNAVILIKYGGSSLEEVGAKEGILQDIIFLNYCGLRPVLVHGGGTHITQAMAASGKKAEFVGGYRVTDAQTVKIIDKVFTELNAELVMDIERLGGKAAGLCCQRNRILIAKKLKASQDIGFVGDIVKVNGWNIKMALHKRLIPVISPLGIGRDRQVYNINADTAAGLIARRLRAEKLVFFTNVKGILEDCNNPDSLISTLHVSEVEALKQKGIVTGGMLPKVEAGVQAVQDGVKKVHIIDAALPHALLIEIFTNKGIGTEIVK